MSNLKCKSDESVASEKILSRITYANGDLKSIHLELREFQERLIGAVPTDGKACEPCPPPPSTFLHQVNSELDATYGFISAIRETLSNLRKF